MSLPVMPSLSELARYAHRSAPRSRGLPPDSFCRSAASYSERPTLSGPAASTSSNKRVLSAQERSRFGCASAGNKEDLPARRLPKRREERSAAEHGSKEVDGNRLRPGLPR